MSSESIYRSSHNASQIGGFHQDFEPNNFNLNQSIQESNQVKSKPKLVKSQPPKKLVEDTGNGQNSTFEMLSQRIKDMQRDFMGNGNQQAPPIIPRVANSMPQHPQKVVQKSNNLLSTYLECAASKNDSDDSNNNGRTFKTKKSNSSRSSWSGNELNVEHNIPNIHNQQQQNSVQEPKKRGRKPNKAIQNMPLPMPPKQNVEPRKKGRPCQPKNLAGKAIGFPQNQSTDILQTSSPEGSNSQQNNQQKRGRPTDMVKTEDPGNKRFKISNVPHGMTENAVNQQKIISPQVDSAKQQASSEQTTMIVQIAGKTLDEVETMEKQIDLKFKTILLKFKKAVKCILQGLMEQNGTEEEQEEAIGASKEALTFLNVEIGKLRNQFDDLISYRIPSIDSISSNPQPSAPKVQAKQQQSAPPVQAYLPAPKLMQQVPTINLKYKSYGVRDEVNLPIEDFSGSALAPEVMFENNSGEVTNLLILNRELYDYEFDEEENKVKLNHILIFKKIPTFFLIHQANLILNTAIYSQRVQSKFDNDYFGCERYSKIQDLDGVNSGLALTEDCLLLSHLSNDISFLSILKWVSDSKKYETVSHQTHELGLISNMKCINDDGFQIIGVSFNTVYHFILTGDPISMNDGCIDWKQVYANDDEIPIIDIKIQKDNNLVILFENSTVIMLRGFENPDVISRITFESDLRLQQLVLAPIAPNSIIYSGPENENDSVLKLMDIQGKVSSVVKPGEDSKEDGRCAGIKVICNMSKSNNNDQASHCVLVSKQKSKHYSETQLSVIHVRR